MMLHDNMRAIGSFRWCASMLKTVGIDRKRIVWDSGRATVRPWWSGFPIELRDGDVVYSFPTPFGPAVDEVVKREALEGKDPRPEPPLEFEFQTSREDD